MKMLGNAWLRDAYRLRTAPLIHESAIGTKSSRVVKPGGGATETYIASYDPGDDPLAHVEFALKYDDLELDLLRQAFLHMGRSRIATHIARKPTGKYSRQIGFLCEFLTPFRLDASKTGGNYTPLLDAGRYFTASPRKDARWRVDDNLLGTPAFCPVIRRTPALEAHFETDWHSQLGRTIASAPPGILNRVLAYFYLHETKSSFDIERETITPERSDRFVKALKTAGHETAAAALSEPRLTALQNTIVDPRYAESGYRTRQNYLGPSEFDERAKVGYIPPPPDEVRDLMAGLVSFEEKSRGAEPVLRAAVTAFQFVFIHPFMDGNGRLHRFLLHDSLTRDGFTDDRMMLPLSAAMIEDIPAYARTLEAFSNPEMELARYELDGRNRLALLNAADLKGYWRYPDLTVQVEFTARLVERTIARSLPEELQFLARFDRARAAIRAVVDIPNQRLDILIQLLRQNDGRLAKRKRSLYKEISDAELKRIERAFAGAFPNRR